MLTIAKMGVGQENYYLKTVASGLEDYYSGAGEIEGRWLGRGAERLGLLGEVDSEALKVLLAGYDPIDHDRRLAGRPGLPHTPGWDLTFSAPKSVSILYGLGGIDVAEQVVAAHEAAVAEAVGWLEAHATVSRRRIGGEITTVAGEGLVIAAFRHRTSRLGDPQLHTHALAANVVERNDGSWGALDSRPMFRHGRTAGYLYQAVLRSELTARLGVGWTTVDKGVAEIAGTRPELRALFSKRRAQIEAAMAEAGEVPSRRAAQVAAYQTRPDKTVVDTDTSLYARWEREALEAGVGIAEVSAVIDRTVDVEPATVDIEDVITSLVDPAHGLCASDSSFDRSDVARAWCQRLPAGVRVSRAMVEGLIDRAVGDGRIVELDAGQGSGPVVVGSDGDTRRVGVGAQRWTTVELLDVERRMLHLADSGRNTHVATVDQRRVDDVLAVRADLGDDQAAMVRQLTTSGDAADVVVGRAGTGKTYALAVAVQIWREAGYHPTGVALAARAAAELEAGAGVRSSTIAQLLVDADRYPEPALTDRSVLIVDEAGMVDTRRLAELLSLARDVGAKVVLVGDHHQLPAVEVGGSFAALAQRLDPIELVENRRQVEAWEQNALARLRTGAGGRDGIAEVIDDYRDHDRVQIGENPSEVRAVMALDWYRAHSAGEDVVMVALRREDVAELNTRARALLLDDGTLDDTAAVVVRERSFSVGDRVVCLRNDRRLGVHNALMGTITTVDRDDPSATLTLVGRDGRAYAVSAAYLEAGHLDHGYATTIHKAQGATVDRCLVLGDDRLYRQAGYTAMSRGRLANDLYLIGTDDRDEHPELELDQHGQDDHEDPFDRAVRSLHRDGAKGLASDLGDEDSSGGQRAESLAELWRRWDTLAASLGAIPADPTVRLSGLSAEHAAVIRSVEEAITIVDQVAEPGTAWRRWTNSPTTREQRQIERAEARLDELRGRRDELADQIARLSEERDVRAGWIDANREQLDELDELSNTIEWRSTQAGLAAEIDRPDHVTAHIGQPPVGDRTAWRAAAAAIEAYNARWESVDVAALSADEAHRIHHDRVCEAVAAARPTPRLTPPEPTLVL
ncbi:MAG: relaxase domain-containing protein [Acidimicrobiales bacterium]|nr:relaxase domain-containing protein [Acidimicrobiales bacterium]